MTYVPAGNRYQSMTYRRCGKSGPEQIIENVRALDAAPFTGEELAAIDRILAG